MTIEYRIDHDLRLVLARGSGSLTDQDLFDYQRQVWSRAEVAGYNELMDMSNIETIDPPSADQVRQLADLAAAMDAPTTTSKFAIVAPSDLDFGLGRMFQAYRSLNERSTKKVGVFRSLREAREWLGLKDQCQQPEPGLHPSPPKYSS